MNAKMLIGGVLGGVVYFLLGYLVYGMLLNHTMEAYFMQGVSKPMDQILMLHLALGQLGFGFLLSYVLSKSVSFASVMGGATGGAIVGFLASLSYDLTIYATSNVMNAFAGVVYDVLAFTVISAIAGAVVGWWMGRK